MSGGGVLSPQAANHARADTTTTLVRNLLKIIAVHLGLVLSMTIPSLSEQFTQVGVVGLLVAGSSQMHHFGPCRRRCCVGCSASTMAVSECGCVLLPVS